MAHPYLGQVKASEKARLRRLGAKAGKAWGSSNMYKKKSYPKKNAGTEREFTIPGGKARKRADRMANGGAVRSRHKPHHTTNIVIAAPGGAGGRGGGGGGGGRGHPGLGMPLPARPPLPVGGAGAPPMPMGTAPPIGGGMPLGAGVPPAGLAGAPIARPALAGPAAALPVRPPMGAPGMKRGGAVRKRARGGEAEMQDTQERASRRGYAGYPHSPTSERESALSAHRRGGHVKKRQSGGVVKRKNGGDDDGGADEMEPAGGAAAPPEALAQSAAATTMPSSMAQSQRRGGKVKKRQLGGPGGGGGGGLPYGGLIGPRPGIQTAMPPQQGAPTLSGRPALPAQRQMIPAPNTLASQRLRPAPGTQVGFKRGGKARSSNESHADEAEDKKLFKRMYKEEEAKEEKAPKRRKFGGSAGENTTARGLAASEYHDWGTGYRKRGGHVGDSVTMAAPTTLAGPKYRNQGVGRHQMGGSVQPRPGAGSGLGRIRANKIAAKVPAKTEL